MDYELTVESCLDWFDGGPYVYSASDILLSEARASPLLSDADRDALIEIIRDTVSHKPSYFVSQMWKIVDILERYDAFASIKVEILAKCLRGD